ncbi:hypothetical protein Tco_1238789 [Tanacetum coccineum]
MTTAGTRAVVNTGKGKMDTDLKNSRGYWRPNGNYLRSCVPKDSDLFMLKKVYTRSCYTDHALVDEYIALAILAGKA